MKQMIVITAKGIGMAEMPEFPNQKYTATVKEYEAIEAEYEKQKAQAISEALYFEDQERVWHLLPDEAFRHPLIKKFLIEGTYPIPPDFPKYVEVYQESIIDPIFVYNIDWFPSTEKDFKNPKDGMKYRKVLRFVDEKQESEEELWGGVISKICGDKGRHTSQSVTIEELSQQYTIKRK
jgi:hypothetical protein